MKVVSENIDPPLIREITARKVKAMRRKVFISSDSLKRVPGCQTEREVMAQYVAPV